MEGIQAGRCKLMTHIHEDTIIICIVCLLLYTSVKADESSRSFNCSNSSHRKPLLPSSSLIHRLWSPHWRAHCAISSRHVALCGSPPFSANSVARYVYLHKMISKFCTIWLTKEQFMNSSTGQCKKTQKFTDALSSNFAKILSRGWKELCKMVESTDNVFSVERKFTRLLWLIFRTPHSIHGLKHQVF